MQQQINNGLKKVLDTHGYSFQYAVLKRAQELFEEGKINWIFQAAEFPVEIHDVPTHIDFILMNREKTQYLIAECKRANPALSNWCFVRAPFVRRNEEKKVVAVDEVKRLPPTRFVELVALRSVLTSIATIEQIFHIAFELKTDKKGDLGSSGRGAIQDAVTQVFRGVNGFIEFLSKNIILVPAELSVKIVPVIFTTARIWTSMVDISDADIETGKLNMNDLKPTEVEWIWYRYPLSPEIKHNLKDSGERTKDLSETFEAQYGRTVAIVSPKGIDDFLSRTW